MNYYQLQMNSWITYSIITALLIAVEFILVKRYSMEEKPDITIFSCQARIASVLILIAAALVMYYTGRLEVKKSSNSTKSWIYAFLVGLVSSGSLVFFYLALDQSDNPGYPSAVRELSIVLIFVLSAIFLGKDLKSVDKRVYLGVFFILLGAILSALYG